MIQLRVLLGYPFKTNIEYFPETVYSCQRCGIISTFYSIPPKKCTGCNIVLPNLRELKEDVGARKNYHLYGE